MIRQDTEELCLTEDEFRIELEKKVLNQLRKYLCDHLEPERYFPYLQSKEYLDSDSCEQIRHEVTTKRRVDKMLEIIMKSGLHPLTILKKAIKNSGPTQKFVAKKLEDEYTRVSNMPENVRRLNEIRERHHLMPTYVHPPDPPPYLPFDDQHPTIRQPGSSYPSPSAFPTTFSKTPTDFSHGKSGYPGSTNNHSSLKDHPSPDNGLTSQIYSDQHEEWENIQSKTNDFTKQNLMQANVRSPRTPSEHDDSVVISRPPVNTENLSTVSSNTARLLRTSTLPEEATQPKVRNFKSLLSHPGSFQPSCFSSSNFESYATTLNDSSKPVDVNTKPRSSGNKSLSPQHGAGKPFSPPLEPIPSVEAPSEASITLRNPPTEHEDPSIVSQTSQDDDSDSLEISTDSEVSEQQ